MSGPRPARDPKLLTFRRVLGFDDLRDRQIDGESHAAEIVIDVDAPIGKIERLFAGSHSPDDIVVMREGDNVLAHLPLSALGTQVMRLGPPPAIHDRILAWGERTGIHWCADGLHFTVRLPCREHGGSRRL